MSLIHSNEALLRETSIREFSGVRVKNSEVRRQPERARPAAIWATRGLGGYYWRAGRHRQTDRHSTISLTCGTYRATDKHDEPEPDSWAQSARSPDDGVGRAREAKGVTVHKHPEVNRVTGMGRAAPGRQSLVESLWAGTGGA